MLNKDSTKPHIASAPSLCSGLRLTPLFAMTLVLQRNFTQLIEPRSLALAMGDIGCVVPLLPVGDEFQHCWGVEFTPGQDAAQQYLHLGDGQARGFFLA
jgi:hypothetical protein